MAQAVAAQALARAAVLLEDPNAGDRGGSRIRRSAAAHAAALDRPVGPPLRVQPRGRAQRAAAGDPLAAPVRRGHRRHRGGRARATPRRIRAGDVPAVRHRRLVAATSSAARTRRRSTSCSSPSCSRSSPRRRRTRSGSTRRSASTATTTTRRTVTPGPAPPTIYPQPLDGFLDVAQIPITLSQNASVTLAVGGKVSTFRLTRGAHDADVDAACRRSRRGPTPCRSRPRTARDVARPSSSRRSSSRWTPRRRSTRAARARRRSPGRRPIPARRRSRCTSTSPTRPASIRRRRSISGASRSPGALPLAVPPGTWQASARRDELVRARDDGRPRNRYRVGGVTFFWLECRIHGRIFVTLAWPT